MNIYTVYDKVAEESGPLFEQVNDGCAMRAYRKLFSNGEASELEYKLLFLGTIDKKTARIKLIDIPQEIYVPEQLLTKEVND